MRYLLFTYIMSTDRLLTGSAYSQIAGGKHRMQSEDHHGPWINNTLVAVV